MKTRLIFAVSFILMFLSSGVPSWGRPRPASEYWRALHLLNYNNDAALDVSRELPELAENGINVLVLEIDYHTSSSRIRTQNAQSHHFRGRAPLCRRMPQKRHPSDTAVPVLGISRGQGYIHPADGLSELDLTPGRSPQRGPLLREWDSPIPCLEIVFPLLDEIIDAFQADALHVGMDEVFLLGSDLSPARGVRILLSYSPGASYDFSTATSYRPEGSRCSCGPTGHRRLGAHVRQMGVLHERHRAAIDMVPKDIIMGPWHYNKRETYTSIPMLLDKVSGCFRELARC
jgi:hypothetical protein